MYYYSKTYPRVWAPVNGGANEHGEWCSWGNCVVYSSAHQLWRVAASSVDFCVISDRCEEAPGEGKNLPFLGVPGSGRLGHAGVHPPTLGACHRCCQPETKGDRWSPSQLLCEVKKSSWAPAVKRSTVHASSHSRFTWAPSPRQSAPLGRTSYRAPALHHPSTAEKCRYETARGHGPRTRIPTSTSQAPVERMNELLDARTGGSSSTLCGRRCSGGFRGSQSCIPLGLRTGLSAPT